MKKIVFAYLFIVSGVVYSQEDKLKATVINTVGRRPMVNVHILNLNKVRGAITDKNGYFEIEAKEKDTIFFSFLGFKPIKVKVTKDMLKFSGTKIVLTELALALEEVIVEAYKLTGYLDIDAKNVPIVSGKNYQIAGLTKSYEAVDKTPGITSRVLGSIFNPIDFLYNSFGKKNKQLRKLKRIKKNKEIKKFLTIKYDRKTISELLQIEIIEIEEILRNCNYSNDFIKNANDLQVIEAVSGCYEEYKVLKDSN